MSIARVWRAITWRHWAWAVGLGIAVAVLVPLQTLHINTAILHLRIFHLMPWYLGAAVLFVVAIGCVEASERRARNPAFLRYVVAAAAASVIWLSVVYAGRDHFWQTPTRNVANDINRHVTDYKLTPRSQVVLTVGFEGVVHGWLATMIYARLRSLRIARRALEEAEMERAVASRDLLDAQLRAAQAQVDPIRLLADLDEIEAAYAHDPAGAEARIDELIAFLRAAIPRLRADDFGTLAHAQGHPR